LAAGVERQRLAQEVVLRVAVEQRRDAEAVAPVLAVADDD
jgi:hypothetical protein